jgi:hypothetical protein
MGNQWFFVVKLFLLAGLISAAIKYLLPLLNIPATTTVVLSFVLTPSILLATLLAWRQYRNQPD